MKKIKKATEAAPCNNVHDKDNNSSRIIQQVRKLFSEGGKYRAKDINMLCDTNDSRKIISTLRNKEGWNIQDMRLPNGCKLYWLVSDDRQTSIDWEGGNK